MWPLWGYRAMTKSKKDLGVCVCVCVQLQANYEFPAAFPHSGAMRGSVKNQKPK